MKTWEAFCDIGYYDMWAVRPIGDESFNSQELFHVPSKEEAKTLSEYLNAMEFFHHRYRYIEEMLKDIPHAPNPPMKFSVKGPIRQIEFLIERYNERTHS